MFWGDQGTRQVERVNLDGTNRQTIIQDGLVWPNQLAFSYTHRSVHRQTDTLKWFKELCIEVKNQHVSTDRETDKGLGVHNGGYWAREFGPWRKRWCGHSWPGVSTHTKSFVFEPLMSAKSSKKFFCIWQVWSVPHHLMISPPLHLHS